MQLVDPFLGPPILRAGLTPALTLANGSRSEAVIGLSLEGCSTSLGYGLVLLTASAANTYGTDYPAVAGEGQTAREDHDAASIRIVYAEELIPRLGVRGQLAGENLKCPRCVRLVHRHIDTSDPSSVHPDVGHQIPAFVNYCYVHRLLDFVSFVFAGGNCLRASASLIDVCSWELWERTRVVRSGTAGMQFHFHRPICCGRGPARLQQIGMSAHGLDTSTDLMVSEIPPSIFHAFTMGVCVLRMG
jgi:hypothetical protein